jgi:signal transduction histidine kinase
MKLNFSLKQSWTFIVLFAVIVPVMIVMIWYGSTMYKHQLNSALSIERHANELLRNKIESEIQRFNTLLKNKSDPLSFLLDRKDKPTALRDINGLLKNIIEREQAIHEVMILSKHGVVIAAVDPGIGFRGNKILSDEEKRFAIQHWGFGETYEYPEVVIPSLGRDYIGPPKKHEGYIAFSMAVPIGNPAKAILIALINVDKLWLADEEHGIGIEKTRDYMLDRRGTLLTEIDDSEHKPGDIMTHLAIARTALINGEWPADISYIGVIDQPVYGTLTTIPSLSWTLISEITVSNIIQPIWISLRDIFLLSLLGMIIFVWFVLRLVSKTLRPIQYACKAIDHVARGDYQFVLNPSGIRELDTLTTGFNDMAKARQQAELMQCKLVSELEEKNAELERFAYTVSHDLKSPLVTISGFIGLLEKDIADANKERIEADFVRISDAANTMQDLLNDLLELSRIGQQASTRVDVSVESIVSTVLEMLAAKINASQAKITVESELPVIHVEEARFKEVYLNLIENSIKYRRDDVALDITIGVRHDQKKINEVVFFVKDNGLGIDARYQEKIFGLFERLDNDSEGTGIGLAIVKRIIEVHGGRIWVESDGMGHGSTFNFVIP